MQLYQCSQVKLNSSSAFLSRNLIKKSTCVLKCFPSPTLLLVLWDKDAQLVTFQLGAPVSKTNTCKVDHTHRISRGLHENGKKTELPRDICCVPSPISSSHNVWICLLTKSSVEIYDYNPLSIENTRVLSTYNIDNTSIVNPVEVFIIDSNIYQQRNLLILDSKGHLCQKCIWSANKNKVEDTTKGKDFHFSMEDKIAIIYSISNFEVRNGEPEGNYAVEKGVAIDKSTQVVKWLPFSNLFKNSFTSMQRTEASSLFNNKRFSSSVPIPLLSASSSSLSSVSPLTSCDVNVSSDFVFVLKNPLGSSSSSVNQGSSSTVSVNTSAANPSRSVILDKRYLKEGTGFEHILIGKSLSEALSVPTESEIRLFEKIQSTKSSMITCSSTSVNEEITLVKPVSAPNSSGSADTQFIQSLYSIRSSSLSELEEQEPGVTVRTEKSLTSDDHSVVGIIQVYCESSMTENSKDDRYDSGNLNEELLSRLTCSSTSSLIQEIKELSHSLPRQSDAFSQYCTVSLFPSSFSSVVIPSFDIFTTFPVSSTEFLIAASHTITINQQVVIYYLNLQKSGNQSISPVHSFSYSSSREVSPIYFCRFADFLLFPGLLCFVSDVLSWIKVCFIER
jgi:hypothetical protein